jgi:hypothetical protein
MAYEDTYLFEIPIHAWTFDDHLRMLEEVRKKWAESSAAGDDPERYARIGLSIHGYPWEYNEVVGWLRLMADGWYIKVYLWWTREKRIARRLRRTPTVRRFEYFGKVAEIQSEYMSNEDIYEALREDLVRQQSEWPIRRSHVDLGRFDALAPYVDWRGALAAAARRE